jgi:uncharacterized protein
VRRADKEITDKKEIAAIMKKGVVCRVAFAEKNKPYVLPFNYGFKGRDIYIHCAREGKKLDILKTNKNVCVEIDIESSLVEAGEACRFGYRYKSVVGFGKAVILDKTREKTGALGIIMKHITGKTYNKFSVSAVESVKVIKIRLDNVTGKKSGF